MKSIVRYLPVALFVLTVTSCDQGGATGPARTNEISAMIASGEMDQKTLLDQGLSENEKDSVVNEVGKLRGWNTEGDNFTTAKDFLFNTTTSGDEARSSSLLLVKAATFQCTQKVEQNTGFGMQGISYVAAIQQPAPNECGTDTDDRILIFNLYWGGTNPDKARYWSNLYWVRAALGLYPGGLSTNGLCSITAHTCVGSRVTWLGNDLYSVFLWHF
jgi:hypothetical protein